MAYGLTYLAAVNKVLTRLRESTVTTVNATTYSSLIGLLVNQVKRDVENAWRWQILRSTMNISTVAGTITYTLAGSDERLQILDAWNANTKVYLSQVTWQEMNAYYFGLTVVATGSPTNYTPNGVSAVDGTYQLDVWPKPVAIETLSFDVYKPQPDLVADSDLVYAPYIPIVEGTLARAYAERGEDGGTGSLNQQMIYTTALSDAISIDANQQPTDLIWAAM